MKMITAKLGGPLKNDYLFGGMKFSFCTAPIKRHVKQIGIWETCRESMMQHLRNRMVVSHGKIDVHKTRLLVYVRASSPVVSLTGEDLKEYHTKHREQAHEQMQTGLRLIHHFEERVGWPLTRVYKVAQKSCPLSSLHMVVGSSRWQKSTHYLSLYLLMIRLGRSKFRKSKLKDHEEYMDALQKFSRRRTTDAGFVGASYLKWEIFLKNQDKIFAGRNRKGIFSKKTLVNGSNGFNEGIRQLCHGWSRDLVLADKFKRVCEESGVEQENKIVDKSKKVVSRANNRS